MFLKKRERKALIHIGLEPDVMFPAGIGDKTIQMLIKRKWIEWTPPDRFGSRFYKITSKGLDALDAGQNGRLSGRPPKRRKKVNCEMD